MIGKISHIIGKKLARSMQKRDINIEQLKKMQEKGAILIDVRSPQEYNEGHIEKSISIPEYDLKLKVNEILPNKDETIIVYCSSGVRSRNAQKTLNKMGYTNVYNLYGGYQYL